MQGEKDAGRCWYQLLHGALTNAGLHHSVSDHAVFTWKQDPSEMFITIATDDCLCVCNDRSQFLRLKQCLEELFVLTLQEGNAIRFLNLQIIQSPHGISIDQTDHIVDTITGPYFKHRTTSKLLAIISPFQTDSDFETTLYDSPILTGSALHQI
jgi:hypothetical protein